MLQPTASRNHLDLHVRFSYTLSGSLREYMAHVRYKWLNYYDVRMSKDVVWDRTLASHRVIGVAHVHDTPVTSRLTCALRRFSETSHSFFGVGRRLTTQWVVMSECGRNSKPREKQRSRAVRVPTPNDVVVMAQTGGIA